MNLDTGISYKVSIFHLNKISSISAMICIMQDPLCQITRMSPFHYSTSLSLVYLSIALPAHSFFQNAPHSETLTTGLNSSFDIAGLASYSIAPNTIYAFGLQLLRNLYSSSSLESIGGL